MIYGNSVGSGYINRAYILVDDVGNEYPSVITDEEVEVTATPNDVRLGKVAVLSDGVVEGTKEIPSYNTREGCLAIPVGSGLQIRINNYNYTKLQALICEFNSSFEESVATIKVSVENKVYPVDSTEPISNVILDHDNKLIDLGIFNDSDTVWVLRYFTYKEIY